MSPASLSVPNILCTLSSVFTTTTAMAPACCARRAFSWHATPPLDGSEFPRLTTATAPARAPALVRSASASSGTAHTPWPEKELLDPQEARSTRPPEPPTPSEPTRATRRRPTTCGWTCAASRTLSWTWSPAAWAATSRPRPGRGSRDARDDARACLAARRHRRAERLPCRACGRTLLRTYLLKWKLIFSLQKFVGASGSYSKL